MGRLILKYGLDMLEKSDWKKCVEVVYMDIAKRITELREEAGENRKEFSVHTGIPVRTLEDWGARRRTPPEYIPRLIEYQLEYEKLAKSNRKGIVCIGGNEPLFDSCGEDAKIRLS